MSIRYRNPNDALDTTPYFRDTPQYFGSVSIDFADLSICHTLRTIDF
ncbi:MAG: hypothetical protein JNL70_13295 [Saprospiraceae bacterium]|nr:hypothetical protein [Saprospiraceae bacterium]